MAVSTGMNFSATLDRPQEAARTLGRSETEKELAQAMSTLSSAADLLGDLDEMAKNATEYTRDTIALRVDGGFVKDARALLAFCQMVRAQYRREHPDCKLTDGSERAA